MWRQLKDSNPHARMDAGFLDRCDTNSATSWRMVGRVGFEPTHYSLLRRLRLPITPSARFVAEPVGFEPTRIGVKGRCLNRLAKALCGAGEEIRTPDLSVKSRLFYLLNYTSVCGTG